MRNHLTPIDIANQARLSRTQHRGTIILPEGSTDSRVLSRFINKSNSILIPSYGKDNSLGALSILENSSFNGIVSLVDSDFWNLENYNHPSPNIHTTDSHDFETLMISSPSFEKIISEFASEKRIKRISQNPRDYIIDLVKPIGYLRWISSPFKDNLSLKFKGADFSQFLDSISFVLDEDRLINTIIGNTPNCSISATDLKNKLVSIKSINHDPIQLISGHDVMRALDIGLRLNFGNVRGTSSNFEIIESALRMGYEKEYFIKTDLYNSLKNWECQNFPYKIF